MIKFLFYKQLPKICFFQNIQMKRICNKLLKMLFFSVSRRIYFDGISFHAATVFYFLIANSQRLVKSQILIVTYPLFSVLWLYFGIRYFPISMKSFYVFGFSLCCLANSHKYTRVDMQMIYVIQVWQDNCIKN